MTTIAPVSSAAFAAPAATPDVAPTPNHCATCDTFLHGRYCHECGEVAAEGRNTSLRAFAHQAVQEIVDFDSKTVTTFRTLFRHPGQLTAEYMAGRTKRYLSPLKLYVSVFAALTFAYSIYAPLRIYDVGRQLHDAGHWDMAEQMLAPQAARVHLTMEQLLARWSDLWANYQSWFQLLNVVCVALILAVLYRRARRPMLEHTVFAFHLLAFDFAVSILLWPVYYVIGLGLSRATGVLLAAFTVMSASYFYLAARRVYGGSAGHTVMKTLVYAVAAQLAVGVVSQLAMLAALVHTLLRPV